MGDKALRGNRLTKQRRMGLPSLGMGEAARPITSFAEEVDASPTEALGIHVSGGYQGKPHSTKRGRLSAAANFLNRAWGQKHYSKKKKKKGVEV